MYHKGNIDPQLLNNRTEAEIKYLRKTMGVTKNISCGIEFTKEYKEYPKYPHFNYIMTIHDQMVSNGNLPFEGSISDQPSQIMEIMELLTCLDGERERSEREKQKRKPGK